MAKEMVAMKWTREKPTVPGWYWYREPRRVGTDEDPQWLDPECVRVRINPGGAFAGFQGSDSEDFVADCHGEWAGPLSPPEE